jgi:DNA polymerase
MNPSRIWLDVESYSEVPLSHGTYKYAENCEVDILALALDDGPVTVYDTANEPSHRREVRDILLDSTCPVIAHNAMFDRNALRLGNLKIEVPIKRWRCNMVRAMAHGLPGALEKLGDILQIEQDKKKLREGHALMMLFCKPQPFKHEFKREQFDSAKAYSAAIAAAREAWPGRATRQTHPEKWARYLVYAGNDVEAMRAIAAKLPAWNYTFDEPPAVLRARDIELAHWHRDQAINDRGFALDLELAAAALKAVDIEQARLAAEAKALTAGAIDATTQRDKLLDFIFEEFGFWLPDLRGATVDRALENVDLPDELRALLINRTQASTSSTAKYKAILNIAADGRACGTIQFDGAARTRRAAGRKVQPQNYPSRGLLPQLQVEQGIDALKLGIADLLFDNPMLLLASTLRGTIVAPPGKKLVCADLSNIEGRDNAWLAKEEWKIQAFRDFDTIVGYDLIDGEPVRAGHDLYKLAYAKMFGGDPEGVTKNQRQIGKTDELACGYQGSLGAFITFATAFGLDLDEMADNAWDALPPVAVENAESLFDWYQGKKLPTYGLRRKTAVAIFCFVYGWRDAHPAIRSMWGALEQGFRDATEQPGHTFEVGRFRIRRDGWWLRIVMPSGRALCYPSPHVDAQGKLSYMGVDQFTHKWKRINTYGGRLCENACQSFARDILYDAMPAIEEAGYRIVLHVHDEVICEVPDEPQYNAEHLSSLLAANPPYALDMPLAAAGFEAYRYKKD